MSFGSLHCVYQYEYRVESIFLARLAGAGIYSVTSNFSVHTSRKYLSTRSSELNPERTDPNLLNNFSHSSVKVSWCIGHQTSLICDLSSGIWALEEELFLKETRESQNSKPGNDMNSELSFSHLSTKQLLFHFFWQVLDIKANILDIFRF